MNIARYTQPFDPELQEPEVTIENETTTNRTMKVKQALKNAAASVTTKKATTKKKAAKKKAAKSDAPATPPEAAKKKWADVRKRVQKDQADAINGEMKPGYPRPGTAYRKVWDYADDTSSHDEKAKRADVLAWAKEQGINEATAKTQYSKWAIHRFGSGRNG